MGWAESVFLMESQTREAKLGKRSRRAVTKSIDKYIRNFAKKQKLSDNIVLRNKITFFLLSRGSLRNQAKSKHTSLFLLAKPVN